MLKSLPSLLVRLIGDSFLKVVVGTVAPLRLLDKCAVTAGIFFTTSSNFCPFYVIFFNEIALNSSLSYKYY